MFNYELCIQYQSTSTLPVTIPGVPKKTEQRIFSNLRSNSAIFVVTLYKIKHLLQKRMIRRSLNLAEKI